tara:strand:+ start:2159 stop:5224 length:3066 start_codon:yes stop_codon:yes gene_type:complete
MTLTQITKIRGAGIHTTSNIVSHNINSSGIITAVAFKGPFTGSSNIQSGIVTATKIDLNGDIDVDGHTNLDNVSIAGVATFTGDATFSGNVSIGGTLTYEDVTNIDSVGIITARDGLKVLAGGANIVGVLTATTIKSSNLTAGRVVYTTAGGQLESSGNLTYNGTNLVSGSSFDINADLDVDGHTNLDNVNIVGVTTTSGDIHIGTGDILFNNSAHKIYTSSSSYMLGIQGGALNMGGRIELRGGNSDGDIRFFAQGATSTQVERLRIASTGNITIGTAAAAGGKLYFESTSGAAQYIASGGTNNQDLLIGSSAGEFLCITSGGNVNIGGNFAETSHPLNVSHSTKPSLALHTGTDLRADFSATIGITSIRSYSNSPFTINIGGSGETEAFRINASAEATMTSAASKTFLAVNTTNNNTRGLISMQGKTSGGDVVTLKIGGFGDTSRGEIFTHSNHGLGFATNNATTQMILDTSGRLRVANTNFSANGDGDTVIIGTTSGTRGMTIVSGNNNTGNIFFGDDGDNDIGGVVYNHNGDTLNFRANGLTRATVTGTAFWVDDGTNARLKLAPDSATLNMIISTTTNNGSYCNLLYGAADHIFKYGGNETARLNTAGNYTITGEFASAQDYPVIKPTLDLNFVSNKVLDPRFEYYRYGPGSYIDENGKVVLVGEDVPRFDHDPDTRECKGLLIEGERTNLFPNGVRPGDKFNHSKAGTFTENTTETTAPDGSYTATKWTFTNNDPYLYHNQTLLAGVTYTMSMWVKAGTNMAGDWLQFRIGGGPYSPQADSIIPADGTWRRITHTRTIGGSNESGANIGFEPQTSPSGNPSSGDVIYIWGAQLESGSTASSFIPTYGYTQTRGPDKLQITGKEFTDFYNQTEGTIFLSASYETDARNVASITFDDISNESEYTDVGYRAGGGGSGNVASYIRTDSGGDQYFKQFASAATQGNEFKVALAYKDNDYASSANGEAVHTDTSGTTSKLYDRLRFSDVHNVGLGGVGHYRRLMYYSKRITNSQLKNLTS